MAAKTFNNSLFIGSGSNITFNAEAADKILLHGNSYGLGVEAAYLTYWSIFFHRWRVGATSSTGGVSVMELSITELNLKDILLTNVADPTDATHVGDRGYNDARYPVKGTDSHVFYTTHTFAVAGEIKVPSGQVDFIPPFFVMLNTGQTGRIVSCRHRINSGTSVTAKLQNNGADITGFTGISVTTSDTTTTPTAQSVSNGARIALVVTAVSGTPTNMSFTVTLEHTVGH